MSFETGIILIMLVLMGIGAVFTAMAVYAKRLEDQQKKQD